ncbi:hypothetical protein KC361_g7373 [Hortaea werneckii]|nr:hypothetical protein KC361_g7373 [Hortaea werneckii]
MFDDNFSFGTPRSPSLDSSNASSTRGTSRSVSPCSPTGPFPAPSFSVTDLAAQFAGQRIRRDAQMCYDSCESYAAHDDDAGWAIPPADEEDLPQVSRSQTTPIPRAHSPSTRIRRQANARLLCSSTHREDITALVARMVQSNDQCSVNPPPDSLSTSAVIDEDEGYDSSNESLTPVQSRRCSITTSRSRVDFRRSSDMKKTGACVMKAARMRREKSGYARNRSAEKSTS